MSRSKRIAQQLGMSHGAAVHLLRKNILFSLLKRLKEDICFVCGKQIEDVKELSIEHKLPWENISAELFWGLDNIAFSHMRCNRPHIQSGGKNVIKVPDGTIWCGECKSPRPSEEFTPGAKNQCSPCKRKRNALRER